MLDCSAGARARRLVAAALASLLAASSATAAAARPRPNIVLVTMDDMGYGDLSSFGAPDIRTPGIDRLAREGIRLTDFYANAPTCTPTRAALITGRYQQRVGLEEPLHFDDWKGGLPASPFSLPALLKTRGYATALVGKWHLGQAQERGPNAHGFAVFYGFLTGAIDFYSHTQRDGTPGLFHNLEAVKHDGYLTDELTRRAIAFVEAHRPGPFFLHLSYNAPHWPFQPPGLPPEKRSRKPWETDGTRHDYRLMLERADAGVAELLRALDRLGVAGHTLVAFTSDNGGEWLSRNAPFFHRKYTVWEGGIRVPTLLRWPGVVAAGSTSGQVGITMDLTATFLAAAGVERPAGYQPDGVDLAPALSGARPEIERTLFWRATPPFVQKAVRSGKWKYVRDQDQDLLFDLSRDKGEREDLARSEPAVLRELRAQLARWEKDVDAERVRAQQQE
jgi:arylsulfatase A-like enzyme